MRTLIIMRGIPGSGKSRRAVSLQSISQDHGYPCVICSADNFFLDASDHYTFDPSKLREAHASCFSDFKVQVADRTVDTIIVDNTNTKLWEFQRYIDFVGPLDFQQPNFRVIVLRCEAPLDVCQKRCVHGVPHDKIQQMRDRFEDFSGEEIICTA